MVEYWSLHLLVIQSEIWSSILHHKADWVNRYNGLRFRLNRKLLSSCLHTNWCTFITFPFGEVQFNLLNFLFIHSFALFKHFEDIKRCCQMLTSKRTLIHIGSNHLRHIIDVMSWRVRITIEWVQFCMLWDLCD